MKERLTNAQIYHVCNVIDEWSLNWKEKNIVTQFVEAAEELKKMICDTVVGDFHNSWDKINKIGVFEDFGEDFILSLNLDPFNEDSIIMGYWEYQKKLVENSFFDSEKTREQFLQKYKQYKQTKGETDDQ